MRIWLAVEIAIGALARWKHFGEVQFVGDGFRGSLTNLAHFL
jgi:hypothetical protein